MKRMSIPTAIRFALLVFTLFYGLLVHAAVFRDQQLLRNGNFSLDKVAWYLSEAWAEDIDLNGQPSRGLRLEPLSDPYYAFAVTELYWPEGVDSARVQFKYRLSARQGAQLGFFNLRIVTGDTLYADNYDASYLARPLLVDSNSFPGYDWYAADVALSSEQLQQISQARAQGQRIYLLIELYAQFMAAWLDDVSLEVSGNQEAPVLDGAIAFVEQDAQGFPVAVSRIDPDGDNQQQIWRSSAPAAAANKIYAVAWKPDGSEIAFTSNHESGFSAFHSDIYALRPDGSRLRRISNPPSIAELRQLQEPPRGAVTGSVLNTYGGTAVAPFLIYVQGALDAYSLELGPPNERVNFTIPDVVDLGEGDLPYVVFAWGDTNNINCRELQPAAIADVKPGETVDIGALVFEGYCNQYHATTMTWKADGSEIMADVSLPRRFQASGEAVGRPVFSQTLLADSPAWSPTDAEQLLYYRWDGSGADKGIYLSNLDGGPGQQLVSVDAVSVNIDWLPDGRGFVFTDGSRLIQYDMGTGQQILLAQLFNEYMASPSVSPDGKHIVFERYYDVDGGRRHSELWLLNRLHPNQMWNLTDDGNARAPDWGKPIKLLAAGDCYLGSHTLAPGTRFDGGEQNIYSQQRISNEGDLTVTNGAHLTLLAPEIELKPNVRVAGGYLRLGAERIDCEAQMPDG